jgi:uncharacterized protein YdeI (YjbR/CyaY-like superfamily)
MGKKSPQVDGYIAEAADFARPILNKVRKLFHRACPDIEETMKWGFPHFEYKGIVGSVAAFKHHAGFGLWKATLLKNSHALFQQMGKTTMGNIKLEKVEDLPPDKVILAGIKEAVALNEQGVRAPKPRRQKPKLELSPPEDFLAALKRNRKALAAYEAFSPSHQREYVEWIIEAKQLATRQKRIATAVEWMADGKSRHWKYQK